MIDPRPCVQLIIGFALSGCALELPVPDPGNCAVRPDAVTVALYRFEEEGGQTIDDATGKHPGDLVGTEDTDWQRTEGPEQCGRAIRFTPAGEAVPLATIPYHPDWELDQGSIEFRVRFNASAPADIAEGLLSRDAVFTGKPGHLLVFRACDSRVVVRLQRSADEQYYVCSQPMTDTTWHHLGINFGNGPLRLYVDGQLTDSTTPVECETPPGVLPCGTGEDTTAGIDGNANPWVIGAVAWSSPEGPDIVPARPLAGAIDSLQIRRERWDFAD